MAAITLSLQLEADSGLISIDVGDGTGVRT
jgi:hypothetical protein